VSLEYAPEAGGYYFIMDGAAYNRGILTVYLLLLEAAKAYILLHIFYLLFRNIYCGGVQLLLDKIKHSVCTK
jgi:hypothetical protein